MAAPGDARNGYTSSTSLTDVATYLWIGYRWILATTLLSILGSFLAYILIAPMYLGSVVVVEASSDRNKLNSSLGSSLGQLGSLANLTGISIGSSGGITEEALAVLRSEQFTESFLANQGAVPDLYARQWDPARARWRADTKPPSPARAAKYFRKKIEFVVQDKKTGLTTINVYWKDPVVAAKWANELVRQLNFEMRMREIDKADASIRFLEKEESLTTVASTHEAIGRLLEAQIRQRMIAHVTPEFVFRIVDKAVAPDREDIAWPDRLWLLLGGPLIGFACSALIIVLLGPHLLNLREKIRVVSAIKNE